MTVGDLKIAIGDLYVENMLLKQQANERQQKIDFLQRKLTETQQLEGTEVDSRPADGAV